MASAISPRRLTLVRSFAAAIGLLLANGAPAAPPVSGVRELIARAASFSGENDPLQEDGALKTRAYRLWRDAGCGFRNTERAAWILGNDELDVLLVEWPRRGLLWREVWSGPAPARLVAVIHTHPDSVDPRPSPNDVATAKRLGVPNYAVSRQGIWKATPLGEIVKIDGEAWIVRCASPRGCGAGEPSRVLAERLDGRPPETRDGHP